MDEESFQKMFFYALDKIAFLLSMHATTGY